MSIDLKSVELTADVLKIYFSKICMYRALCIIINTPTLLTSVSSVVQEYRGHFYTPRVFFVPIYSGGYLLAFSKSLCIALSAPTPRKGRGMASKSMRGKMWSCTGGVLLVRRVTRRVPGVPGYPLISGGKYPGTREYLRLFWAGTRVPEQRPGTRVPRTLFLINFSLLRNSYIS